MKPPAFDPREDGMTHINAYSRGRTGLGCALSNFAKMPFTHPVYGDFASIEGFWYFLGTGCKDTTLRQLHGYSAKKYGSALEQVPIDNFDETIEEAIVMKIEQNHALLAAVLDNKLPVVHYYVYGSGPYRVVDLTKEYPHITNAVQKIKEKYPPRALD